MSLRIRLSGAAVILSLATVAPAEQASRSSIWPSEPIRSMGQPPLLKPYGGAYDSFEGAARSSGGGPTSACTRTCFLRSQGSGSRGESYAGGAGDGSTGGALQENIQCFPVPGLRCPDERASLAFGHDGIVAPGPSVAAKPFSAHWTGHRPGTPRSPPARTSCRVSLGPRPGHQGDHCAEAGDLEAADPEQDGHMRIPSGGDPSGSAEGKPGRPTQQRPPKVAASLTMPATLRR